MTYEADAAHLATVSQLSQIEAGRRAEAGYRRRLRRWRDRLGRRAPNGVAAVTRAGRGEEALVGRSVNLERLHQ